MARRYSTVRVQAPSDETLECSACGDILKPVPVPVLVPLGRNNNAVMEYSLVHDDDSCIAVVQP